MAPLVSKSDIYPEVKFKRTAVGMDGHMWLPQLAYAHEQSILLNKDLQTVAKGFRIKPRWRWAVAWTC